MTRTRTLPALVVALATVGTIAGCAGATANSPSADESSAKPHGYVAGAEELSEPSTGLLLLAEGQLALLDLASEERQAIADLPSTQATASAGDGRFAVTGDGDGSTIVDSGVWTVDHGDHQHFYRATPRAIGTLPIRDASIQSSEQLTVVRSHSDGTVMVLDRDRLGDGEIAPLAEIEGVAGAGGAYPLGGEVVVVQPSTAGGTDATVTRYDTAGAVTAEAISCEDAGPSAATRAGVVVDCAEDALVLSAADGGGTIEQTRVDRAEGPRPSAAFGGRGQRPVLAAPAGERGYWLFDVRQGEWSLHETEQPLRAAVAADDDEQRVLGITRDGELQVLVDGAVRASAADAAAPITAAEPAATAPRAPELIVDRSRAYLRTEAGVSEIDYADDARVSRRFDVAELAAALQVGA